MWPSSTSVCAYLHPVVDCMFASVFGWVCCMYQLWGVGMHSSLCCLLLVVEEAWDLLNFFVLWCLVEGRLKRAILDWTAKAQVIFLKERLCLAFFWCQKGPKICDSKLVLFHQRTEWFCELLLEEPFFFSDCLRSSNRLRGCGSKDHQSCCHAPWK